MRSILLTIVALLIGVGLLSNPVGAAPIDKLSPQVSCVVVPSETDPEAWPSYFIVYFGYTNNSNKTINVAHGDNNNVSPGITNLNPTTFYPGGHEKVFSVGAFYPTTWVLGNQSAIASLNSPRCL